MCVCVCVFLTKLHFSLSVCIHVCVTPYATCITQCIEQYAACGIEPQQYATCKTQHAARGMEPAVLHIARVVMLMHNKTRGMPYEAPRVPTPAHNGVLAHTRTHARTHTHTHTCAHTPAHTHAHRGFGCRVEHTYLLDRKRLGT